MSVYLRVFSMKRDFGKASLIEKPFLLCQNPAVAVHTKICHNLHVLIAIFEIELKSALTFTRLIKNSAGKKWRQNVFNPTRLEPREHKIASKPNNR